MKQIMRLLLGRTAKNSAITVGANVIYGLLIMVFFIATSRLLGPEKFGILSIALAIFAISFDILSLGTSQSLIRFVSVNLGRGRVERARQFANTIFKLRLAESFIVIVVGLVLGKIIALRIYNLPELVIPLTITIAAVGGILLVDFVITLLQAYELFVKSALVLLAVAVLKLIFFTLLILTHQLTILGVTLAFVITPLLASLLGLSFIPRKIFAAKTTKIVTKKLFHFSKWMALWGVTASLAGRIDILLLGKLTSTFETGIYSAASRLATGFIIIGSSFAAVLTPKISRVIGDSNELKRQFKLIWKVVALLIVSIIGVAIISTWLIPFMFGSDFVQSVLIFQSLSLGLIFFVANIPANVSLLALGHSKWIGLLSLIQLIVAIALSLILIPQLGAQGAAIAIVGSYLTAFLLSTTYAIKKIYSK